MIGESSCVVRPPQSNTRAIVGNRESNSTIACLFRSGGVLLRHDGGKRVSTVRRERLSHFADSSCGKCVNAMNSWQ